MSEESFDFIDDNNLRENIIASINYTAILWLQAENISKDHHQELYRTIVFYNASVVEALLLFLCQKKSVTFSQDKYTVPHKLPGVFQNATDGIYVTIKTKAKKGPSEITFADLIANTKEILGEALSKKISELKDLRNTVHLAKARTLLKQKTVTDSSDTIFKLIRKIQKEI